MSEDAATLRHRLVDEFERYGWLTDAEWIDAFRAVPREAFLPRCFTLGLDGRYRAVGSDDPGWLDQVYRDHVVPTQLDGDPSLWERARDHGPVVGTPTCSSSQPSLMAIMLHELEIRDGDRVLEIGTGTGYNTALLCHRLGSRLVTSVDIDAGLVAEATDRLASLGYTPTVVAADGERGYERDCPYDRLIATCSVVDVPWDWVRQLSPGGVILTSLYRELGGGILAKLRVDEQGEAHGHVLDELCYFMPPRSHPPQQTMELIRAAAGAEGELRLSRLPGPLPGDSEPWYAFAALSLPGVARLDLQGPDGLAQWLVHRDGSWAYHDAASGGVEQDGPRRLWSEIEQKYQEWVEWGDPERGRIGITVTANGQRCHVVDGSTW
jgi:protein-L-isoaspartate(D-aspartate) O-methyltransferase